MLPALIILRIFHIGSAILWVGGAATMLFIVAPTVRKLGPVGGQFMNGMVLNSNWVQWMPIHAVVTTLSGVILYVLVSNTFNPAWFRQPSSIVLSIGSVFGLLAFGHGSAALGKYTGKSKELATEMTELQGPPSDELMRRIRENAAKIDLHSKISFSLMVVAVVTMASHRYVIW